MAGVAAGPRPDPVAMTDGSHPPGGRRQMPEGGRLWLALAAEAFAGAAVAASPWLAVYRMGGAAVVLYLAAVLSVALPLAVALGWRRGPEVSYALSALALVIVLLAGVSADPAHLARGLAVGPSHLLTDTLPLATPRYMLVPAVVLVWLAGTAVGEVLGRTRGVGAALALLAASYLVACAAASGAPGRPLVSGALLLGIAGALAATRRLAQRPPSAAAGAGGGDGHAPAPPDAWAEGAATAARRRAAPGAGSRAALTGVALVAVLAVAGWAGVPRIPGLGGREASVTRRPPTVQPVATDPVDVVAALRDDHPRQKPVPMLTVSSTTPTSGYLPIAVLDNYDGGTWTFDRTFEPTGGRIPGPPPGQPVSEGPVVHQQIQLLRTVAPALPLMPFAYRPTQVSGVQVDANATTGMVVPSSNLKFPLRYQVTSRGPLQDFSSLPRSDHFAAGTEGVDTQLPAGVDADLSGTLRYLAAVTGEQPAPTVAFLQAVEAGLRGDDHRVDPLEAPPGTPPPTRGGTSLAEVISAVIVSQQATPEQFATLFVVVARELGVPARLVTGFRLTGPAGGPLPAGVHTATDRQAWTWAQLPVAGVGWVDVDPTPDLTSAQTAPPPVGAALTPPTTVAPPEAVPNNLPGGHAVAPPVHVRIPHHPPPPVALIVGASAAGTLLGIPMLLIAAAALRRAWRRRARRRSDPRALAVGAWLEALDALARAGVRPDAGSTSAEVARLASRCFGPEVEQPFRSIGELADRAMFSRRAVIDPAAALAAWRAAHDVTRRILSGLERRQRIRAVVAVGHGPRRSVAPASVL